jgi:penicillin-binding protein 1C
VLDARTAFVLTDILSDDHARLATFGDRSALELPFRVAAKTGTSKGFRDNIAVGFSADVTVAVWVGNFDGSPMQGISGVTGAGPLFHDAMLAAARAVAKGGDFTRPEGLVDVEVCALSGGRPTSACPHRRVEIVPHEALGALASCDVHVRARVDRRNGLLAGPACTSVDERVFERFDATLVAWARGAGRPLLPIESSPFCPTTEPASSSARLRIAYPPEGARFVRDPAIAAQEGIRVRIDAPDRATQVRLVVDGRAFDLGPPFERTLPLVPGTHVLRAEAGGAASDAVTFSVD